nr:NACHT domain-containing protein [Modestobacter italicus]
MAKWVFKLWVGSDDLADASSDIGSLVAQHVPGLLSARKTSRQFDRLAESISERLEPLLAIEFRGLKENEQEAAILALNETLSRSHLSVEELLKADLNANQLESVLRANAPDVASRAMLAESAVQYYDLLLAESCTFICQAALSLPNFASAAAKQMMERESDILDVMSAALDRLPVPRVPESWGEGGEDARFENKYLQSLVTRLDVLELYGASLDADRRQYPLSVAYISLTASQGAADVTQGRSRIDLEAPLGDFEGSDEADDVSPARDRNWILDAESVRVDAALGGSTRVLVGGQAGSGKTTLLQWLAVTAARNAFAGRLEDWNGKIPFLVRLRQFSEEDLPTPDQLIFSAVPNIAEVMPPGWVHRVLESDRALLLVDGVDELSEERRDVARRWLEELILDYPTVRVVVTSRTTAISKEWRELKGFAGTELLPMDLGDMRALISHWHRAAAIDIVDPVMLSRIRLAETSMLATVRENAAIRSLCTSPLLCALICALHRDSTNKLPENRVELYETALRTLLISRDEERDVTYGRRQGLNFAARKSLLRDFALWLLENDASDATEEVFKRHVERGLRQLTHVKADAEAVATELLQRSGVLRMPVEGRVDFIHKTFLEYLAAEALVEDEAIDKIVLEAHRDQWREVVILAAGHAPIAQRERLLNGLIDRGDAEPANLHRLYLLAVACLETSYRLSENIVQRLESCLARVMPPANMTEAAAVASAGNVAVPQLTAHMSRALEAAACVRALSLIGTEEALLALRQFSADSRVTVTRQLIRAWTQFDPERYAEEVLADSPLDRGYLKITDPELLPLTRHMKQLERVYLDCPGRWDSFEIVADYPVVTGLDASFSKNLTDLSSLRRLVNLRVLSVRACSNLVSTQGLEAPALRTFDAGGSANLADLSGLSSDWYNTIHLSGTAVSDLAPIVQVPIRRLVLSHMPFLTHLEANMKVSELVLGNCRELRSLDVLGGWQGLGSLQIFGSVGDVEPVFVPDSVMELFVSSATTGGVINRMRLGSGLKRIIASGVTSSFVDQLAGLPSLTSVTLYDAEEISDVVRLATSPSLQVLTLTSGLREKWMSSGLSLPGFTEVGRSRRGNMTFTRT